MSYQQGSNKINLDMLEFSHTAMKGLKQAENIDETNFVPRKDKKDRATVELVLDPRTRVILVKMLKRNFITEINGCVSTGKEANVYHALTPEGNSLAIKIYKTSILVFKDREKYIAGEFRFRKGFNKSNPRKMVKLWAEKEIRNLKRIYQSGIPCPNPLLVKSNVLVMEFIGEDYKPAPKLRNANLSVDKLSECYIELVLMMRTLYQECKLVHADLSEYNVLYFQDKIWLIDVSQSVEHDHPHALDFLRRDIACVNMYFKKSKVGTFSIRDVFDFITDTSFSKDQEKDKIDELIERQQTGTQAEEDEDDLFTKLHIPRTLQEISIKQMESDLHKDKDKLVYAKLTGLNIDENQERTEKGWINDGDDDEDDSDDSDEEEAKVEKKPAAKKVTKKAAADDSSDESSDEDSDNGDKDSEDGSGDSDDDEEEGEEKVHEPNLVLKDKEANKERKKKIKEEKKEKRKQKVKKYDKKKANEKKNGQRAHKK